MALDPYCRAVQPLGSSECDREDGKRQGHMGFSTLASCDPLPWSLSRVRWACLLPALRNFPFPVVPYTLHKIKVTALSGMGVVFFDVSKSVALDR